MLCRRGLSCHAVSVRVCVCVSVTFVHSVKTNKRIFIFSTTDSHTILVFPYQTSLQYSDGNHPPNGGVECRWDRLKSRFWAYIGLHCVLSTLRPARCYQHDVARPRSRQLWHLSLVYSKRRSLLMAEDDDEILMTKRLNVTT